MQPHKTAAPQFVLDPNPAVEWPVTVSLPADGGTLEEFRFIARVRVLPDCEYETFDKKADGHKSAAEILGDNAERLPQLVTGWSGITNADGTAVPIEKLRELILHSPYGLPLSKGLWRAIAEVRFGMEPYGGATLGNSVTSPADGQAADATS